MSRRHGIRLFGKMTKAQRREQIELLKRLAARGEHRTLIGPEGFICNCCLLYPESASKAFYDPCVHRAQQVVIGEGPSGLWPASQRPPDAGGVTGGNGGANE